VPGIFLRRDDGELVHLRGEMYQSEDQLQALLEDNPELLLGETAESESPSKYLLVRREAGVPEAGGGSDRWLLDHVFLDGQGVPTLVEVKTNLAAKRLRLVFVADHVPASLQTIVEFLNEQMRAAEVLAVEVNQHKGDGLTVLTTQIIGRTSTAQYTKSVTEKRDWSNELALEELRRSASPEAATVADRLLLWATTSSLSSPFGRADD
jgi:hypothetical protein